jgi:hypothetical protein
MIASTIAALQIGKSPVIIGDTRRGAAFAELVGDQAADCGLCLGTVTIQDKAASLLTPAEILNERFRDDFWLIVRDAEAPTVERLAHYAMAIGSASSWRFLVCTSVGLPALVAGALGDRREIAFIDLD